MWIHARLFSVLGRFGAGQVGSASRGVAFAYSSCALPLNEMTIFPAVPVVRQVVPVRARFYTELTISSLSQAAVSRESRRMIATHRSLIGSDDASFR